MPTQSSKSVLRKEMKRQIKQYSQEQRNLMSENISQRLESFLKNQFSSGVIGLYSALSDEPNLSSLVQRLKQFSFAFPLCRPQTHEMDFYLAGENDFELGVYGLFEPKATCPMVLPHQISAMIIPALAYDSIGTRLGRGAGYYDRFLAKLSPEVVKIGVIFPFQRKQVLPRDEYDLSVDWVVSSEEFYEVKKSREV